MKTSAFRPVVLPGARSCRIEPARGPGWTLWLAAPNAPAPPSGFPFVVVLDGESFFATVAETVARLARRPQKTGVPPMVVLGIGYEEAGPDRPARRYADFTAGPPSDPAALPPGATTMGGAAAFRRMLVETALPLAAGQVPLDRSRGLILGHSLAGRFVLETLLLDPSAFAAYVAVSPSLWWDGEALADAASTLRPSAARAFIAVGEREAEPGADGRTMVARAQAMATLLAGRLGEADTAFHLAPDEDHGSVTSTVLARALRFSLGR